MNRRKIDLDSELKKVVVSASKRSPFYNLFFRQHNVNVDRFRGFQDYDSLPIIRKEDILSFIKTHNKEMWNMDHSEHLIIASTTGSTGKRLNVLFTEEDIIQNVRLLLGCLQWWGYKGGPINVIMWEPPRGIQESISSILFKNLAKITQGKIFFEYEIEEDLLRREKIEGETSTLINLPRLWKLLEPSRIQEFNLMNLKYIFTLVTPSQLKTKFHLQIKNKLPNMHLIPCYGFTEALFVGASCPHTFESGFIHVVQQGLFHILGRNNTLNDEGTGELVYTSLDRAFPFIKYCPGDIVTIEKENGCGCGYSGINLRFERRLPLTVKIPYADGYFIDIVEVVKIIEEILPRSHVLCVYGEHPHRRHFFLAIFIGLSKVTVKSKERLIDNILEKIIVEHIPKEKIDKDGLLNTISKWRSFFPIFLVDIEDIPKEPMANKPRIFLNILEEEKMTYLPLYKSLLSKIEDFYLKNSMFNSSKR